MIADFGLARWIARPNNLTHSGAVLGTPNYMAPEQAAGRPQTISTSSDVYSLGAILYELLTGAPPFRSDDPLETLRRLREEDPVRPRLRNPAVPRGLETICLKALAREPHRRYASAFELAEDLRRFHRREPIRARPARAWELALLWARRRPAVAALLLALAAVTVIGLGAVLWQLRQTDQARAEAETTLYFSRIAQARLEWSANELARARTLLEQCRPRPGEPDLRGWEWHYLRRLCRPELATLRGHRSWVHGLAFSPDGRLLASVGGDPILARQFGEVKVWDVASRRERWGAGGLARPVAAAEFSPDGRLLAAGSGEVENYHDAPPARGELRLYDSLTGKEVLSVADPAGPVRSVAFHPSGRWLATGSRGATWTQEGRVTLREVPSGRAFLSWPLAGQVVNRVAFSPDGKCLAVGHGPFGDRGPRHVSVYALPATASATSATPEVRFQIPGALRGFYHPDGKALAVADGETLRLHDAAGGQEIRRLGRHDGIVTDVSFRHDGLRLATASSDGTVRTWDYQTGAALLTLRGHAWGVRAVAYHLTRPRIASASQDGTVKLWNATTDPQARTLRGFEDHIDAVGFTAAGRRLAALSLDGRLLRWDAATWARLDRLDLTGRVPLRWPRVLTALDAAGQRLAVRHRDDPCSIALRDTATGQELAVLRGHRMPVTSLAFGPDGASLASAASAEPGGDGRAEIKAWDLATGRERLGWTVPEGLIVSLAFRPDGRQLASAGFGQSVRLWALPSGRLEDELHGHQSAVAQAAYSPDGRWLATAGYMDGTARLWELESGKQLRVLTAARPLLGVAFTPDGRRLAAIGADAAQLWDPATGHEAITLRPPIGKRPDDLAFNARLAFSPDGHHLVTTNWDRTLSVWDATPLDRSAAKSLLVSSARRVPGLRPEALRVEVVVVELHAGLQAVVAVVLHVLPALVLRRDQHRQVVARVEEVRALAAARQAGVQPRRQRVLQAVDRLLELRPLHRADQSHLPDLRVAALRGGEVAAQPLQAGAQAGLGDRVARGRLDQDTVRRQRHALAGRHQRDVAGGQQRVDLALVPAPDVDDLAALPVLAEPLHVDAPGLLAELEEDHLLGVHLALDRLAADQADDVGVERLVALEGLLVELARCGGGSRRGRRCRVAGRLRARGGGRRRRDRRLRRGRLGRTDGRRRHGHQRDLGRLRGPRQQARRLRQRPSHGDTPCRGGPQRRQPQAGPAVATVHLPCPSQIYLRRWGRDAPTPLAAAKARGVGRECTRKGRGEEDEPARRRKRP
jgi:WD40 repeat protein